MTTVAHAAELLHQALKLVANVDAPFLDKAQRLRLAEDAMTCAVGFLDEIVAAHPEECAGHWPATSNPNEQIAADGPLYVNDEQPDEIDEDPYFEGTAAEAVLFAAIGSAPWLSCAHLAAAVREACHDQESPPDVIEHLENALGISLTERNPDSVRGLVGEGLLPKPSVELTTGSVSEIATADEPPAIVASGERE